MKERYSRNVSTITYEECLKLREKRVAVIGCGGLGGYIIEMLGRIGVGEIVCVDGDIFDQSNLNRQLFSDEESLGINKALKAKKRMKIVNSEIKVQDVQEMLCEENAHKVIGDVDVVVDALDSIQVRLMLQRKCEVLNIPLVHGAIAGWFGQVTTVMPGDNTLNFLYGKIKDNKGGEKELGNPSFTPAHIASLQVSEVIKVLLNKGKILRNKIMFIDMLNNDYEVVEF